MDQDLLRASVSVVDMFDQANTNGAIDGLNRGDLLRLAIEELRRIVNKDTQLTAL